MPNKPSHPIIIMKFLTLTLLVSFIFAASPAPASVVSRPVQDVMEHLAAKSGRVVGRGAEEALEKAFHLYGESALQVARKGGEGLAKAAGQHGDEVYQAAARVPEAVPALVNEAHVLLPLVQRYGDDVLRLEARVPRLGQSAAKVFPDKELLERLQRLPAGDAQKVVQFATHATNPAVARQLLETVEKQGSHFLARLDPKQILAYGLSGAMITAASAPLIGAARMPTDQIPDVIKSVLAPVSNGIGIAVVGLALAVAARMFLFYRSKRRTMNGKPRPVIDIAPPEDPANS
jgi:hypothetical protein